ncbi:MAG: MFS transporter [Candidatus Latescibacteria bacterium]|nr:MFS transporter [Candidatus Latescibacterota bacterium]
MANGQSLKEYYKFDVFGFGNGFGGSVWGGLTYFIGIPIAFLTFLKASSMQIGLVTAIFWAGFAVPQVWAAYATETQTIKKKFMAKVLILSSFAWLILGIYILMTNAANQTLSIWLFLILFIWACSLTGMFIPGQFSLLFKIIPSDRLGQLLGILFAIQFGGIALAGPVATKISTTYPAPTNYAIIFIATFVISLLISLILLSLNEPEGDKIESEPSFGAYIGKCLNVVKTDKTLRKFLIGKWLMSGHYVMLAFMLAYLMSERGFDQAKAGLFTSLHGIGLFIGGFTITRIADIYGPKQMLLTSHLIAIIYTLMAWLLPDVSPYVVLAAFVITGLAQVSDNVGYSNMCLLCCPTIDKSTYVAVTNVGVNLLVVPLPIILGQLMDMKILNYNSTFTIVMVMMVAAVIYILTVMENPKAFIDMKAAAKK